MPDSGRDEWLYCHSGVLAAGSGYFADRLSDAWPTCQILLEAADPVSRFGFSGALALLEAAAHLGCARTAAACATTSSPPPGMRPTRRRSSPPPRASTPTAPASSRASAPPIRVPPPPSSSPRSATRRPRRRPRGSSSPSPVVDPPHRQAPFRQGTAVNGRQRAAAVSSPPWQLIRGPGRSDSGLARSKRALSTLGSFLPRFSSNLVVFRTKT